MKPANYARAEPKQHFVTLVVNARINQTYKKTALSFDSFLFALYLCSVLPTVVWHECVTQSHDCKKQAIVLPLDLV